MAQRRSKRVKIATKVAHETARKQRRVLPETNDTVPTTMYWKLDPETSESDWTIEVEHEDGDYVDIYHVHKVFLSLGVQRSQYFATTFQSQGLFHEQQTKTSRLKLPKSEAVIFPTFLNFMYGAGFADQTCDIPNLRQCMLSTSGLAALFSLQDYFIVPALKAKMEELLQSHEEIKRAAGKALTECEDWSSDPLACKLVESCEHYVPTFFRCPVTRDVLRQSVDQMTQRIFKSWGLARQKQWFEWVGGNILKCIDDIVDPNEAIHFLDSLTDLCAGTPPHQLGDMLKLALIYLTCVCSHPHESLIAGKKGDDRRRMVDMESWMTQIMASNREVLPSYFGSSDKLNTFLDRLPKDLLVKLVMVRDERSRCQHYHLPYNDEHETEGGDY